MTMAEVLPNAVVSDRLQLAEIAVLVALSHAGRYALSRAPRPRRYEVNSSGCAPWEVHTRVRLSPVHVPLALVQAFRELRAVVPDERLRAVVEGQVHRLVTTGEAHDRAYLRKVLETAGLLDG